MSNTFDNGTVLPSGLLGRQGSEAAVTAFNRSYRDTRLKAGIVIKAYAPTDPGNLNGLCTEYDVQTIEQFENKGSTPITYKNCLSTQGFGSLADYLEYTLRPKTFQTNKGTPTFSDQDGAMVLIECLDGIGDRAVIVGNFIHPDRTTNISSNLPKLAFEYNGVNIQISNDGSFALTFKGATNSKGEVTDPSQGNTVFQIKKDGSFEFNHSTIDIAADRSGVLNINTKSDFNLNVGANTNVNVTGNTTVNTTGDTNVITKGKTNVISSGITTVDGSSVLLGVAAVESIIKGNTFRDLYNAHTHIGNLGEETSVPLEKMDPSLSNHVFTK